MKGTSTLMAPTIDLPVLGEGVIIIKPQPSHNYFFPFTTAYHLLYLFLIQFSLLSKL